MGKTSRDGEPWPYYLANVYLFSSHTHTSDSADVAAASDCCRTTRRHVRAVYDSAAHAAWRASRTQASTKTSPRSPSPACSPTALARLAEHHAMVCSGLPGVRDESVCLRMSRRVHASREAAAKCRVLVRRVLGYRGCVFKERQTDRVLLYCLANAWSYRKDKQLGRTTIAYNSDCLDS